MKILLAMPWDQRAGGVTHVAVSLAQSLSDRGHRVTFLFPSETSIVKKGTSRRGFPALYFRARDIPRHDASLRQRLSWHIAKFTTLPQLGFHALRDGVDLINIHYPGDGFGLAIDLARRLRVPLVVSAHGSDLFPEAEPNRDRRLLRQLGAAEVVICPSQSYLRRVADGFPSVRDKLRCIYNGYDEREFPSPPAPVTDSGTPVTALFLGHLIPRKGVDVLLQALARCNVKGMHVRIVGDGAQRPELEQLIVGLGLTARVKILGFTDRKGVFAELTQCHLVVVPSREEPFGLVALEAMACGKPVIASAVGGLAEVVVDRVTGLLVPPDDAGTLAKCLDRLADDAAMRRAMGLAGRERASRFSSRATCDAYEALFEQSIARNLQNTTKVAPDPGTDSP